MKLRPTKAQLLRTTLLAALTAAPAFLGAALAQQAPPEEETDVIVVTGTRITTPGLESSSQITSVGAEEIQLLQQPEVEKIIRQLPISIPADGQNVNNGTFGAATINLRGLGSNRNLVMMDGQRITPFDYQNQVDTQVIPTALLDRIDIITGGASTVYGSDAMSGVVNFITKRDFEGAEFNIDRSITGEDDGEIVTIATTVGANLDGGRGNAVLSLNYTDRDGVQGGQRPLGRVGIATADGSGYDEYVAGIPQSLPPDANCQGENAVAGTATSTTLPTRVAIFGGPALGQIRTDQTLGPNCNVFNFNPYNYYQTPQERFGATAIAHYTINDNFEPYARASFSQTNVTQQVAPSGIFNTPFWTPLANPFLSAAQRTAILTAAEAGRTAGTVHTAATAGPDDTVNWRDIDGSGTVTVGDDLNIAYRRRTPEFGPRSTSYDTGWFQFLIGVRGKIADSWDYDLNVSHGESHQTRTYAGYSNLANIANALDAVTAAACRATDPSCVPLNLFEAPGGITPAMVGYSSASALEDRVYTQTIVQGIASGTLEPVKTPWADAPLSLSVGMEYREEFGGTTPDECLKLAPTSCLGGNGGNTLPIFGGYSAYEYFAEGILPILANLDLELGYRYADYDPSGGVDSYKYCLSWQPTDSIRLRAMQQRAVRAPNVEEIASPRTTGLDNASGDPCSIGNAANIDATLRARCIATGMSNAQVGTVEDIAAGQVNVFIGTNLSFQLEPEVADTTTFGVVWQPTLGFVSNPMLTVDYYRIKIEDYINAAPAQGVLNGCYQQDIAIQCAKIHRLGGTLTVDGSGVDTLFENLGYLQAEGIEIGASFGVELPLGSLDVSFNANHYLSNEFQSYSNLPVTDCVGVFASSCGANFGTPLPEDRFIQRTTWNVPVAGRDVQLSYLWRHIGEVHSDLNPNPGPNQTIDPRFYTIEAFDYLDLTASVALTDMVKLTFGATNVFDKDPPAVGNEAADTSSNSLNTFPSTYDPLGQVYSISLNARF